MFNERLILARKPCSSSIIILDRKKNTEIEWVLECLHYLPPKMYGVAENSAPLAEHGRKICILASHKDPFCAVISYFSLQDTNVVTS